MARGQRRTQRPSNVERAVRGEELDHAPYITLGDLYRCDQGVDRWRIDEPVAKPDSYAVYPETPLRRRLADAPAEARRGRAPDN